VLGQAFFLRSFLEVRLTFMYESWSLAIEEWFYLLFPAGLLAGLRCGVPFRTLLPTLALIVLAGSTWARWHGADTAGHTWEQAQRWIVVYRFDALMAGVVAAWVSRVAPVAWRRSAWGTCIAGALLVAGCYLHLYHGENTSEFALVWRFSLVTLGFALLLPVFAQWRAPEGGWGRRSVRAVAAWSYALYLLHLPWFQALGRLDLKPESSPMAGLGLFALQLTGATLLAALAHRWIELPFLRLRDRWTAAGAARP
jgi:peptidoglycan/LPS O-acetylase OafA/YrhL